MQVPGMPMQAGYPTVPGYPQVTGQPMAFPGMIPGYPGQMLPQQLQQFQAMQGMYQQGTAVTPAMMGE